MQNVKELIQKAGVVGAGKAQHAGQGVAQRVFPLIILNDAEHAGEIVLLHPFDERCTQGGVDLGFDDLIAGSGFLRLLLQFRGADIQ